MCLLILDILRNFICLAALRFLAVCLHIALKCSFEAAQKSQALPNKASYARCLSCTLLCITLTILCGCFGKQIDKEPHEKNVRHENISRREGEYRYTIGPPRRIKEGPYSKVYPWDEAYVGNLAKITKEFFRCKGDSRCNGDCSGSARHSLFLQDGKEFVYPILIELLNYIQEKTLKKVVVTCGYRCPIHNAYAEKDNPTSKHMIGAEVDFYVEGMEYRPLDVIAYLMQFFQDRKEDVLFSRYDKQDAHVATPPWYNKQVFIKLYGKMEGRDGDNQHPYPYISVQVRYDRDKKERVVYTWKQAHLGYMRY